MTSISAPMNVLANVLDNIQHDPQAQKQPILGVGMAFDTLKHVPIDMFSSIPHFESEVDGSVSGNVPATGPQQQ